MKAVAWRPHISVQETNLKGRIYDDIPYLGIESSIRNCKGKLQLPISASFKSSLWLTPHQLWANICPGYELWCANSNRLLLLLFRMVQICHASPSKGQHLCEQIRQGLHPLKRCEPSMLPGRSYSLLQSAFYSVCVVAIPPAAFARLAGSP